MTAPVRATAAGAPASSHRRVDCSSSARARLFIELSRELSSATEPTEVQRIFARGLRPINPSDGYLSLSCRGLEPGEYRITRRTLDAASLNGVPGDPWRDFHNLPIHRGGLLGELIQDESPKLLVELRVTEDPVLGDALAPFGTLMAMPLFDQGKALNWAITLKHDRAGYTANELEDAILRSNLAGGTVRNTVLAKQLREANSQLREAHEQSRAAHESLREAHEQIREEIQRIAAIQRSLLPDRMPEIPGVVLAASYETFDTAGGDLYGFRPTLAEGEGGAAPPESPWGILIADASGHGPSAAVVSAMLHAIVHTYPGAVGSPAHLLRHANRHLAAKRIEQSFVTAFAAIFDPLSRKLSYSRAGHEPPLVKCAGSGGATFRLDSAGDVPLGVLDEVVYESAEVQLEPGQTLVLYTDGITEARDPQGRFFGTEGIERALVECTGDPQCVIGSITAALRGHEAGRRPADDQTIVAMKVLP
jgi:sigma-B regulation protein RsbU (phosphoserine phosphatase)